MRTAARRAGAIALTMLMTCSAEAQVVNIWPGVASGSESWSQREMKVEDTAIGTVILNRRAGNSNG